MVIEISESHDAEKPTFGPKGPSRISFLRTSKPLLVSSRRPVTDLVMEDSHETGVVKPLVVVVHPCGPGGRQMPISFPDPESFFLCTVRAAAGPQGMCSVGLTRGPCRPARIQRLDVHYYCDVARFGG